MVLEAAMAMLACARIGAVHSVVGGFAAHELATRIDDANHGSFCQPHAASRPAGLFGFAIVALGAALIELALALVRSSCGSRQVDVAVTASRERDRHQSPLLRSRLARAGTAIGSAGPVPPCQCTLPLKEEKALVPPGHRATVYCRARMPALQLDLDPISESPLTSSCWDADFGPLPIPRSSRHMSESCCGPREPVMHSGLLREPMPPPLYSPPLDFRSRHAT
jgi:hypothetical protein